MARNPFSPLMNKDIRRVNEAQQIMKQRREVEKANAQNVAFPRKPQSDAIQYTKRGYTGKSISTSPNYQWEKDLLADLPEKRYGKSYNAKFDTWAAEQGLSPSEAVEFRTWMDSKEDGVAPSHKLLQDISATKGRRYKQRQEAWDRDVTYSFDSDVKWGHEKGFWGALDYHNVSEDDQYENFGDSVKLAFSNLRRGSSKKENEPKMGIGATRNVNPPTTPPPGGGSAITANPNAPKPIPLGEGSLPSSGKIGISNAVQQTQNNKPNELALAAQSAYQFFNPFDDVSARDAFNNYVNRTELDDPNNPINRHSNRAVDALSGTAMSNLQAMQRGGKMPEYTQMRSWGEDKGGFLADMASSTLGYLLPGAAAYGAVNATRAGQALTNFGSQNFGKRLAAEAAKGSIVGGVMSAGEVANREIINPDAYTAADNLKHIGYGTALGAVADPALFAAGAGIKKGWQSAADFRNVRTGAYDNIRQGLNTEMAPSSEVVDSLPRSEPDPPPVNVLASPIPTRPDVSLESARVLRDINNRNSGYLPNTEPGVNRARSFDNFEKDRVLRTKAEETKVETLRKQREEAIEKQYEYLRNYKGKGKQKGGLGRDEEGYVTTAFPSVSNNAEWYRNLESRSQKSLRELAEKHVDEGFVDEYGQIPPWKPEEITKIDERLDELAQRMSSHPEETPDIVAEMDALSKVKAELEADFNKTISKIRPTKPTKEQTTQEIPQQELPPEPTKPQETQQTPDNNTADSLYNDVVKHVQETGEASINALQRKFKIGYSQAAKFIERAKAEGVIPEQSSAPKTEQKPPSVKRETEPEPDSYDDVSHLSDEQRKQYNTHKANIAYNLEAKARIEAELASDKRSESYKKKSVRYLKEIEDGIKWNEREIAKLLKKPKGFDNLNNPKKQPESKPHESHIDRINAEKGIENKPPRQVDGSVIPKKIASDEELRQVSDDELKGMIDRAEKKVFGLYDELSKTTDATKKAELVETIKKANEAVDRGRNERDRRREVLVQNKREENFAKSDDGLKDYVTKEFLGGWKSDELKKIIEEEGITKAVAYVKKFLNKDMPGFGIHGVNATYRSGKVDVQIGDGRSFSLTPKELVERFAKQEGISTNKKNMDNLKKEKVTKPKVNPEVEKVLKENRKVIDDFTDNGLNIYTKEGATSIIDFFEKRVVELEKFKATLKYKKDKAVIDKEIEGVKTAIEANKKNLAEMITEEEAAKNPQPTKPKKGRPKQKARDKLTEQERNETPLERVERLVNERQAKFDENPTKANEDALNQVKAALEREKKKSAKSEPEPENLTPRAKELQKNIENLEKQKSDAQSVVDFEKAKQTKWPNKADEFEPTIKAFQREVKQYEGLIEAARKELDEILNGSAPKTETVIENPLESRKKSAYEKELETEIAELNNLIEKAKADGKTELVTKYKNELKDAEAELRAEIKFSDNPEMRANPIPFRAENTNRKFKENMSWFEKLQNNRKRKKGKDHVEAPITRKELIQSFEKYMEVPIRHKHLGKNTTPNTLGVFRVHNEVVRSREYGEIQVISHEVGHFLDKKFKMRDAISTRYDSELLPLGQVTSGKNYTEDQIRAEGIAEFIRLLLTDPNTAQQKAPRFSTLFDAKLDNITKSRFEMLAYDVSRWIDQGSELRLDGHIDRTGGKDKKTGTVYSKLIDKGEYLKKLDLKYNPKISKTFYGRVRKMVKDAEESVSKTYALAHGAPRIVEEHLKKFETLMNKVGASSFNWKQVERYAVAKRAHNMEYQGLRMKDKLLEESDTLVSFFNDAAEFELYVQQKHNGKRTTDPYSKLSDTKKQELIKNYKEKMVNKLLKGYKVLLDRSQIDDLIDGKDLTLTPKQIEEFIDLYRIESGLTQKEINDTIAKYENDHEMDYLQQEIVEYNNELLRMLRQDFIKKDAYKEMREKFPDYIPFERELPDDIISGVGSEIAFSDIANPVKFMEGSQLDIISPFETMIKNTYKVIMSIERNKVGKQLYNLANKIEGTGKEISVLDGSESIPKEGIVTVWMRGKKVQLQVDKELYSVLKELDVDTSNWIVDKLSKPAQWLRVGATSTPEFMLKNPLMDVMTASITSKYGFNPFVDLPMGIIGVIRGRAGKNALYDEWIKHGGAYGNILSQDPRDRNTTKDMVRKLNKLDKNWHKYLNPLEWGRSAYKILQFLSEMSEESVKYGEYRNIRKVAEKRQKKVNKLSAMNKAIPEKLQYIPSKAEAAFESRDVMDYQRMGSNMKQVNRITTFLNATVQGNNKLIRAFRERPIAFTIKSIAYISLPTLAVSVWQTIGANEAQKEKLDNARDWERDMFWLVPVPGTDEVARWPKPHSLGQIFANPIEKAILDEQRNNPETWSEFVKRQGTSLVRHPVMISAMMPTIEAMFNRNFFTGGEIVPQAEQGSPVADQYGPNTSLFARQLGGLINVSPRKIDHMIRGHLGGSGPYLTGMYGGLLGAFGNDTMPPAAAKHKTELPGVKTFFVNEPSAGGGRYMDDLYAKQKELRELGVDGRTSSQKGDYTKLNKVTDKLKDMREEYRDIQADRDMDKKDKRRKMDEISENMRRLSKDTLREISN